MDKKLSKLARELKFWKGERLALGEQPGRTSTLKGGRGKKSGTGVCPA
jgi:hypothetical protein